MLPAAGRPLAWLCSGSTGLNRRLAGPLLLLAVAAIVALTATRTHWMPALFGPDSAGNTRQGSALKATLLDDPSIKDGSGQPEGGSAADSSSPLQGSSTDDPAAHGAGGDPAGSVGGQSGTGGTADPGKGDKDVAGDTATQPQGKPGETPASTQPEAPVAIETVEGQQINPNLAGRLDTANSQRIKGWVQDKAEPESRMRVAIAIDDREVYTLAADQRVEHKTLGVIWYFEKTDPDELQDAEKHVVRAFVFRADQHGRTELAGSPRNVNVGSIPRGKLEEATPEKGISGYAWDPDSNKKAVTVIVRIDGERVAEIKADVKNEELLARKIAPVDNCAFRIDWPTSLDDGLDHTVQLFAIDNETGNEHELDGSPRVVNSLTGLSNAAPFGNFDICNRVVLAGWAYDPDAGTGSIDVEIYIDGELFAQVPANSKRDTLRNSKVTPDPFHGFVTTTPTALLDGKTHTVRVFALNYPSGVKVELDNSPRQYRLEENTEPMGGLWAGPNDLLRGWAADPDLGTEPCDIEIYIDGKLWQKTKADRREDWLIGTGFAPNAEHGFSIAPPDWTKDGEPHEAKIYAINYPEGPPKPIGTLKIGVNSVFSGFWTSDKLLDTRISKGLYVSNVSPWFDAYHKGVKKEDVLLEYDGIVAGEAEVKDKDGNITKPGTMTTDFRIWLNTQKKAGDIVKFKFWRDGATYEVDVKLGELKGQ